MWPGNRACLSSVAQDICHEAHHVPRFQQGRNRKSFSLLSSYLRGAIMGPHRLQYGEVCCNLVRMVENGSNLYAQQWRTRYIWRMIRHLHKALLTTMLDQRTFANNASWELIDSERWFRSGSGWEKKDTGQNVGPLLQLQQKRCSGLERWLRVLSG